VAIGIIVTQQFLLQYGNLDKEQESDPLLIDLLTLTVPAKSFLAPDFPEYQMTNFLL
jgi:hypothetical protein